MKYIFVTGGVLSGLGKGITASSIGKLLKARGLKITAIKIDPYLNIDAGTMNPFEHGEVFVLDDGGEVDLDLGNYERFLNISLGWDHNITTGKVYKSVIDKERHGDYLGRTVQIIPHITNEIKERIIKVSEESGADVCLVELGGTVGDIESMPFLEAVRQLNMEAGAGENSMFIHTTLVPVVGPVGEQKTKPTQHSVKQLMATGIIPDMIVARSENPLEYKRRRKIALFCNVPLEAVVSAPNARNIYDVPRILEEQGVADYVVRKLGLGESVKEPDMAEWYAFVDRLLGAEKEVHVACVGKYIELADSYISHIEAFHHVGALLNSRVSVTFIEAEDLEEDNHESWDVLKGADAILVPGGFGTRGIEGKILAAKYARENRIPFLGVCLGFQIATIEFTRNVLKLQSANSSEFDPDTPHPVIDLLPEQKGITDLGATMRRGAYPVTISEGSRAFELYGKKNISERHRHRYEVNPDYIHMIEEAGLIYSGRSPDGRRMEIAELQGHPYYMGSQFHPEFLSRPERPSPLHYGLIKAALEFKEKKGN